MRRATNSTQHTWNGNGPGRRPLPWRAVIAAVFLVAAVAAVWLAPRLLSPHSAPTRLAAASVKDPSALPSLLDSVGHLAVPVPEFRAAMWEQQLRAGHPAPAQAARLHQHLGEWELAQNQQPAPALRHFKQVLALLPRTDPRYGLASFSCAVARFYQGAYPEAADDFRRLLRPSTGLTGYDRRACILWWRQARACAGYHEERSRMGIPEPPQLDPECGAAALAACLRAQHRPYDHRTLLAACRVTGEGSSLQDVLDAAGKLGVSGHAVTADDKGLMLLPKPLVAYVEHDHFIAVVRADSKGVSYLCSDCGPWPGGQVDLTWKQWHAVEPGLYATVTKAGGGWDRSLAALPDPAHPTRPAKPAAVRLAFAGNLSSLHLGKRLNLMAGLPALRGHVARYLGPTGSIVCGYKPTSLQCPPYIICCWDCFMHSLENDGPSQGDPVNLATGEEEYSPAADLTVYNPVGPPVIWGRMYNSLRNNAPNMSGTNDYDRYSYADYGQGWADSYDASVSDAPTGGSGGSTYYLNLPNGARVPFTGSAPHTGDAAPPDLPAGSPLSGGARVPGRAGVPMLFYVDWAIVPSPDGYASQFMYQVTGYTVVYPDRTRWNFAGDAVSGCVPLSQIQDHTRHGVTFVRNGGGLLTGVRNDAGTNLLTVSRATDGTVSSVADCYGRTVTYHCGTYNCNYVSPGYPQSFLELDHVSQINSTTSRYDYGYQNVYNGDPGYLYLGETVPFLHIITVPSPTGTGTSTATINYTSDGTCAVASLVDGNGNMRAYTPTDSTHTKVTISDAGANVAYAYTAGFNSSMSPESQTDGAGNVVSAPAYSDPNDPYKPSSMTDGNGRVTQFTYDGYGNLLTETPPSNSVRTPAITTNTFDYTHFPLGELAQTQEGDKAPTSYTYDEDQYLHPGTVDPTLVHAGTGLVLTVHSPVPGTIGDTSSVTTSYTYDDLGNVLTVTAPGNNSASVITETLNYTSDPGDATHGVPAYNQSPAIGQVLTATDNLGKVMHFRYDSQGNTTVQIDALGNEGDAIYNIANDSVQTSSPATGTTGSGHAVSTSTYLYPDGPLMSVADYDESGYWVRGINYTYGPEGEQLSTSGSTEPSSLTYDALYRTASMADGNGHATHYYYNGRGYVDAVTYPGYSGPTPAYNASTGTWSNVAGADSVRFPSYNNDGDALVRVDGRGVETDYAYGDPEDRFTNVHYVYPTGYTGGTAADVTLGYDAYGRKASMTDGAGATTYAYDDDDHALSTTTVFSGLPVGSNTFSLTYSYYPDGRRNTMTTPVGSFSYSYDAVGRLTELTNPFSETSLWQYYDNNWLEAQTLGNGVATTYQYNARGFTTDLTTRTASATVLSEFGSISYDGVGNRTAVTASIPGAAAAFSGASQYTYDAKNQLTQEQSLRAGSYTASSMYDGAGNPTTFQGTSQSFNSNNQDTANTYDGNGNPTSYQGGTLVFDPENRMTQCVGVETNTYYGDGFRAAVSTGAGTVRTMYDDSLPLLTIDSSGAVSGVNSWGLYTLLSRRAAGGSSSQYYTFDDQGNICQRLTGSTVDFTRTVSAWGSVYRTDSMSDQYGGFGSQIGYVQDATGLYLLGRRFYDAATGRFLTRDPGGYVGGINLYSYVHDNPPNSIDPFGLQATKHPGSGRPVMTNPKSCDFQFPDGDNPLNGDYGYHCGSNNYGPHVGLEDCIDQACEDHDNCTNRANGSGTWMDKRACDLILCDKAMGCYAENGGCQGSLREVIACQHQAWKVMEYFCPFPMGVLTVSPGSWQPTGHSYPPNASNHKGGGPFGPIKLHF